MTEGRRKKMKERLGFVHRQFSCGDERVRWGQKDFITAVRSPLALQSSVMSYFRLIGNPDTNSSAALCNSHSIRYLVGWADQPHELVAGGAPAGVLQVVADAAVAAVARLRVALRRPTRQKVTISY